MTVKIGDTIDIMTSFKEQRELDCKEVLMLLQHNRIRFWSWGAHAFKNIGHKAFRMRVSGRHHKGYVYISVSGADLYDIQLTNIKNVVKYAQEDIYFEDLAEIIDEKVEKIAAYER